MGLPCPGGNVEVPEADLKVHCPRKLNRRKEARRLRSATADDELCPAAAAAAAGAGASAGSEAGSDQNSADTLETPGSSWGRQGSSSFSVAKMVTVSDGGEAVRLADLLRRSVVVTRDGLGDLAGWACIVVLGGSADVIRLVQRKCPEAEVLSASMETLIPVLLNLRRARRADFAAIGAELPRDGNAICGMLAKGKLPLVVHLVARNAMWINLRALHRQLRGPASPPVVCDPLHLSLPKALSTRLVPVAVV